MESEAVESFSNAYVVLESSSLRLRFVRDRSQMFVQFQRVGGKPKKWFPMDGFRALMTGDLLVDSLLNSDSEERNSELVEFLTAAIPDLEARFAMKKKRSGLLRALVT